MNNNTLKEKTKQPMLSFFTPPINAKNDINLRHPARSRRAPEKLKKLTQSGSAPKRVWMALFPSEEQHDLREERQWDSGVPRPLFFNRFQKENC